jgi:phosphate-selective porin OprO and OprP
MAVGVGDALAGDAFEGITGPYGERMRYDEKGLTWSFPEQDVKLLIGGRLQVDTGAVGLSRPVLRDAFPDNVAVRRAWVEPTLTIGKSWLVAFQYDFNDPLLPIKDAFVAWKGVPNTNLTLGNMKVPFSLEWLESSNDTLFAERSLANALVPERRFGLSVGHHGRAWTAVAGLFGNAASNGVVGDGTAVAARATYAPILKDDVTLHLGLAGIHRRRSRGDDDFSLSTRAEAFLFGRPFVDTGTIAEVASVSQLGAEVAYRTGPYLVQAEYIRADVERFGGLPTLGFQGGYVEGSVVLNSGGRDYGLAPKGGTTYAVFKGVEVAGSQRVSRGGAGVFEVSARYSAIDLDDRAHRGGSERDVSVGLSWYPEPNIRFIANYVHGRVRPGTGQEDLGRRSFSVDAFVARVQLYW